MVGAGRGGNDTTPGGTVAIRGSSSGRAVHQPRNYMYALMQVHQGKGGGLRNDDLHGIALTLNPEP